MASRSQLQRGIEVGKFDDPEAADLLLRFSEWTIAGQYFAVLDAHDSGRVRRVKAAGEDPRTFLLHLCVEHVNLLEHPLHVISGWHWGAFDHVNGQHVLRHVISPCSGPGTHRVSLPSTRRKIAEIDTLDEFSLNFFVYGSRPMNAMSLACSSASSGTLTRGPY